MQLRMEEIKRGRCYAQIRRMTSTATRRHITPRDVDILTALDRTPLTVEQLLKLSQTFEHEPFYSIRSVQDRLNKLRQAGWLNSWPYARAARGTPPDYYKLTAEGYRILHGPESPAVGKRHFTENSVAHHHHTHALAEVLVHFHVAAHRAGTRVVNFYRENSLAIEAAGETLYPDGAFELQTPDGRQFNFVIELDNSTETVRSPKEIESWQRKIRIYHAKQDEILPNRFRVLVITTRSSLRLRHILSLSAILSPDKRRTLFYGVDQSSLLACSDPVYGPCLIDHNGRPVPLVAAPNTIVMPVKSRETLATPASVC